MLRQFVGLEGKMLVRLLYHAYVPVKKLFQRVQI